MACLHMVLKLPAVLESEHIALTLKVSCSMFFRVVFFMDFKRRELFIAEVAVITIFFANVYCRITD